MISVIPAYKLVDRLNAFSVASNRVEHYDIVTFDEQYVIYEHCGHVSTMMGGRAYNDVDNAVLKCAREYFDNLELFDAVDLCVRVYGRHFDDAADFIKNLNRTLEDLCPRSTHDYNLKFRAFGDKWDGTAASHYQLTDLDNNGTVVAVGNASTQVESALRAGLTVLAEGADFKRIDIRPALSQAFVTTEDF